MTLATMINGHWLPVKDGDPRAVALHKRHYSRRNLVSGQRRSGFVGIGERMVLLTVTCDALFVWRRMAGADEIYERFHWQRGVLCTVFRNESPIRSSDLIKEAMDLAWQRWPGERLVTFVDGGKIRSTNPGACFKYAGWRRCGMSKGGLVILEVYPNDNRND